MVLTCCVKGCRSEGYRNSGVSFHRFPANEEMLQIWYSVIGVKGCVKYKKVCSNHFNFNDFLMDGLRPRLKKGAIPCLLLSSSPKVTLPDFENESKARKTRKRFLEETEVPDEEVAASTSEHAVKEDRLDAFVSDYIMAPCDLEVCRICFATDCKLYPTTVFKKLDKAYKMLTGLSEQNEDNLPPYLCTECAKRLLNCIRFRAKSLRAHLTMLEIIKKHNIITLESIKSAAKENKMGSSLSVKHYQSNHFDHQFFNDIEHENLIDDIKIENDDVISHIDENKGNDSMVFLPEPQEYDMQYDIKDEMDVEDSPDYHNEPDGVVIELVKCETEIITKDGQPYWPNLQDNSISEDFEDSEISDDHIKKNIVTVDNPHKTVLAPDKFAIRNANITSGEKRKDKTKTDIPKMYGRVPGSHKLMLARDNIEASKATIRNKVTSVNR